MCIYRIFNEIPPLDVFLLGELSLSLTQPPKCRILIDKNVKDTVCNNLDCNEMTCVLSPQANSTQALSNQ